MKTIMIIDDSEAEHFLGKIAVQEFEQITGKTIQILSAYDGIEALDLLDKPHINPDIILLDINMPRMNGHEFLEQYNATQQKNTTIIIMLSSSSQTDDIHKAEHYPFTKNYFVKPLTTQHLKQLDQIR